MRTRYRLDSTCSREVAALCLLVGDAGECCERSLRVLGAENYGFFPKTEVFCQILLEASLA